MRRLHTLVLAATLAALPAAAHAAGCAGGPALAPFADWATDAFGLDGTARAAPDGRLVVRLDPTRTHRLRLSRDVAGDEIVMEGGGAGPLAVDAAGFADLLLRCVRFADFGAHDRVVFDGVDAGFVARRWRIPHHAIGGAPATTGARRDAIAHIEQLTDHGALGVALGASLNNPPRLTPAPGGAPGEAMAMSGALRNTVAMVINADAYANTRSGAKVHGESRHVVEAGGGVLLRLAQRLVVVTASHLMPRRSPNRGVLALTHDGALIPLVPLLHGGRRFDLAVFGFTDPAQEAEALEKYGGVRLAETGVARHAFVFHIGFPDRWQTNDHAGPIQIGAIDLPWVPRPIPVLTSGLITEIGDLTVRASARLAQGDSGGGFFVMSPDGEPLLIGPTSTVRSKADGNPPDAEVATEVTGGIFPLHRFDLPRLMPNFFAAAPAGARN